MRQELIAVPNYLWKDFELNIFERLDVSFDNINDNKSTYICTYKYLFDFFPVKITGTQFETWFIGGFYFN